MRIARVAAYRQLQPFRDGPYICRNQSEDGTDSTIVVLESDDGPRRRGRDGAARRVLRPAFAAGTRAGVAELAPLLVGADPREPRRACGASLDDAMLGQPFVKSALDMAVYDLAAQAAGVSLCAYLGGRYGTAVDLYRSVSQAAPDVMAQQRGRLRRCRLPAHPGQGRRGSGGGRRARARRARRGRAATS